ncbi:MAG: hypothetical protein JWO38_8224 [Gemmataceae bacterium]|nr:hypothetical protein [Gemmataceae bacterium]
MGRGVFAGRAFRPPDVIEVCPVIRLPGVTDEKRLGDLRHYVFKWGKAGDGLAIALGYGSLYNHSPRPGRRLQSPARTGRDRLPGRL